MDFASMNIADQQLQRRFCGCGRPASPDGIMTCKICRLPMMTDEFTVDLEKMMKRIYVQLGTLMDDRNDDPVLSQLG